MELIPKYVCMYLKRIWSKSNRTHIGEIKGAICQEAIKRYEVIKEGIEGAITQADQGQQISSSHNIHNVVVCTIIKP